MQEEYQNSAIMLPPALRGYTDSEAFIGLITNDNGDPDLDKFKSLTDRQVGTIADELVTNAMLLGASDDTEDQDLWTDAELKKQRDVYDCHMQQYFPLLIALRDSYKNSDQDPLTGLFNKKSFGEFVLKKIAKFQKQEEFPKRRAPELGAALLIIDIDRFKPFNDLFDYNVGDEAIIALANYLEANTRDEDRVARLGGDEFGVVLSNIDGEAVEDKVQALRDGVESLYITVPANRKISLTPLERAELGLDADKEYKLNDLSTEILYNKIGLKVEFYGDTARLNVPASFGYEIVKAQSNVVNLENAANENRKGNKAYHPTYARS